MHEMKFTYYPNPILRTKAERIEFENEPPDEIAELLEQMKKACKNQNGVGLAAQQVGLILPVAIIGIPDNNGGYVLTGVVNPRIVKANSQVWEKEEGCLSFPGLYLPITRPMQITIEGWFDDVRKTEERELFGMGARIASHEIDHLFGVLFIDHIDAISKIRIKSELKKIALKHPEQKPILL